MSALARNGFSADRLATNGTIHKNSPVTSAEACLQEEFIRMSKEGNVDIDLDVGRLAEVCGSLNAF